MVGGSLAPEVSPDDVKTGPVVFVPVGPTGGRPPRPDRANPGAGWRVLPKARYDAEVQRLKQRWR
jgi:hypothetical protein